MTVPHRYLFDGVVHLLRDNPSSCYASLARRYDPALTPEENLPGGRMTAGQRKYLETVRKPNVRPRLVAAGFWRIADIE